jgi:hypothetical protein
LGIGWKLILAEWTPMMPTQIFQKLNPSGAPRVLMIAGRKLCSKECTCNASRWHFDLFDDPVNC